MHHTDTHVPIVLDWNMLFPYFFDKTVTKKQLYKL